MTEATRDDLSSSRRLVQNKASQGDFAAWDVRIDCRALIISNVLTKSFPSHLPYPFAAPPTASRSFPVTACRFKRWRVWNSGSMCFLFWVWGTQFPCKWPKTCLLCCSLETIEVAGEVARDRQAMPTPSGIHICGMLAPVYSTCTVR